MTARTRKGIAIAAGGVVLTLVVLECLARFGLPFGLLEPGLGSDHRLLPSYRAFVVEGEHPQLAPNAYTGYRLSPTRPNVNSWGFYGHEWKVQKPAGWLRVACLGGSTTAAPGPPHAYPSHLQRALSEMTERRVEVMNCGVPAWTTAETLVNYFLLVQDFEPDVVVIHHASNDVMARLWPDFRSDYAHYRVTWRDPEIGALTRFFVKYSDLGASISLRGADKFIDPIMNRDLPESYVLAKEDLVPATRGSYLRNIKAVAEHVRGRGALPVIVTQPSYPVSDDRRDWDWLPAGIAEHNEALRKLAADEGYLLVDVARDWGARPEEVREHFLDIVHMTSEGNREKAQAIAEALREAEVL